MDNPKEQKKVCKIRNGMFSWTLNVDGNDVPFMMYQSAEYFENHYTALGYKIEKEGW